MSIAIGLFALAVASLAVVMARRALFDLIEAKALLTQMLETDLKLLRVRETGTRQVASDSLLSTPAGQVGDEAMKRAGVVRDRDQGINFDGKFLRWPNPEQDGPTA